MRLPVKFNQFTRILAVSSLSSLVLYFIGYIFYLDTKFWFLSWNLFLAWLPVLFAYLLIEHLKMAVWSSWQGIVYSFLWLGFLPNSFYIASDFVHLQYANNSTILYYTALLLSFTISGLLLGFTSLFMVHKRLLDRLANRTAHLVIALVLLACSFAIYLGRYLRWNTWDVLINPAGILFDVSDRLINPAAHEQTFRITVILFIVLGTTYYCVWQLTQILRNSKNQTRR